MSVSIHKRISLDTFVSRLATNFGITEDGWRGDLDGWVLGCFRDMANKDIFGIVVDADSVIANYKLKLPCTFEALDKLQIGNNILAPVFYNPSLQGTRNFAVADYRVNVYYLEYPYVWFGTESGHVDIHYYPTINGQLQIPAIEPLLDYISYKVITYLTLRGLKHPMFVYPELMQLCETYRSRARNACNTPSPEESFYANKRIFNLPSTRG